MRSHFPALIIGDDHEGYCATVLGTPVLGQGETPDAALTNASEILAEVIEDLIREGEAPFEPGHASQEDLARGRLAVIQADIPATAA